MTKQSIKPKISNIKIIDGMVQMKYGKGVVGVNKKIYFELLKNGELHKLFKQFEEWEREG